MKPCVIPIAYVCTEGELEISILTWGPWYLLGSKVFDGFNFLPYTF